MKKQISLFIIGLFHIIVLNAQATLPILYQNEAVITFGVDDVKLPNEPCGAHLSGKELAKHYCDTAYIYANSFPDDCDLVYIGEDVVYQMMLMAWLQNRPIVLSPDVIWLTITQQFATYMRKNPNELNKMFSSPDAFPYHEPDVQSKRKILDLTQTEWTDLVSGFASSYAQHSNSQLFSITDSEFSTTHVDERIAFQTIFSDEGLCYDSPNSIGDTSTPYGIPSVTLLGTPDDWREVVKRVSELENYGLDWWISELIPVLNEFVYSAEGHPNYWFWKRAVKASRPQSVKSPENQYVRYDDSTLFDGWFLRLFLFFPNGGHEAIITKVVPIGKRMLPEIVKVPLLFHRVNWKRKIKEYVPTTLATGILGVREDPDSYRLTPVIGWFVYGEPREKNLGE